MTTASDDMTVMATTARVSTRKVLTEIDGHECVTKAGDAEAPESVLNGSLSHIEKPVWSTLQSMSNTRWLPVATLVLHLCSDKRGYLMM